MKLWVVVRRQQAAAPSLSTVIPRDCPSLDTGEAGTSPALCRSFSLSSQHFGDKANKGTELHSTLEETQSSWRGHPSLKGSDWVRENCQARRCSSCWHGFPRAFLLSGDSEKRDRDADLVFITSC